MYDGKVDHKDIKTEHFLEVQLEDGTLATSAVVYAVALRRKVRVVRVPFGKKHRLYFSTDTEMEAETIVNFHFNLALTATNVAKAAHWLSIPKEKRASFPMADIKTMNHNALLMDRFFSTFGVNPHLKKNQKLVKELLLYGTIAA